MYKVVSDIEDVRQLRQAAANEGKEVALVPTMGALHEGHLDLIKTAARYSDQVFVSIYVNPTQFGPNEDLDSYPRRLEKDLKKLHELQTQLLEQEFGGTIACVFTPTTAAMYPAGLDNTSHVIMDPQITQVLEGKARPTFFQGVATVVMKLLNIVQPDRAWFGQKDIQQLVVLQRMVQEFHLNLRIHSIKTKRLPNGLAMSSRNSYLGDRRYNVAPVLSRALRGARNVYFDDMTGSTRSAMLAKALQIAKVVQDEQRALPPRKRVRFEIEYLSLTDPITLKELDKVGGNGAILSGAMVMLPLEDIQPDESLGKDRDANRVRLIDNMLLSSSEMDPYEEEIQASLGKHSLQRSSLHDLINGPTYEA